MGKVRRTVILILTAALVVALPVSAAASAPPRGVLTAVEYKEFLALQKAERQKPKSRNLAVIARQTCKSLTNVSRLTSTQHAECEASLIYSFEFFAFPYAIQQCEKLSATAQQSSCALTAIDGFKKSVRAFIRTNAASTRAADPRHFTRRCLDYLLFTKRQAQATNRLSAGLTRYARAIRGGSGGVITAAGTRLDSDLVSSRQAMSLTISVSACRHE
jgi:UrcA family protein